MVKCNKKCEVFSRVVGYYRPVQFWNEGKQQEFKERKVFCENTSVNSAEKIEGSGLMEFAKDEKEVVE